MERINQILGHLRRLLQAPALGAASDGQLLERFHRQHDQSAFAALVERHGPMVRGVCRRLLPDENDIDDAFQAVFLVLARRAAGLRQPASLASWLHGVARRVALNVRRSAARRRGHERQAGSMTPARPEVAASESDLRPVIDEELQRLPDKYRLPLVLCYLEGKTNEEAAQILSWTKGTVSGRLARARDRLRLGLARRGIALTASALLVPLSTGEAALPAALKESTVLAAMQFAAAGTVAAGSVSAEAVALAQGVLQAMFLHRIKTAALTVAFFGLCFTGAGLVAHHVWAEKPTAEKAAAEKPATAATTAATPAPEEKKEEPKVLDVGLSSAYLFTPLGRAHRIMIGGRLGGDAQLHLDPNTCEVIENGDTNLCTAKAADRRKVKLEEVPNIKDPAKRRLYEISGAPEPMRLVVPAKAGPYRLLVLNDKGNVTRVLTLEANPNGSVEAAPGPRRDGKPEPAAKPVEWEIPITLALRTAYLEDTFIGGHQLQLRGKPDGDGLLDVEPNSCELDQFGDPAQCTQKADDQLKVKFKEVTHNDDLERSYRLYDLVGVAEPTRLMIDLRVGHAARLLSLKDGKVVRVVTLEPMPAPEKQKEPKEVDVTLTSAYLETALADAHRITLQGRLGGDAQLILDGNGCTLGENGNPNTCTEKKPASHQVKLLELPAKADVAKRRLFDISGAPKPMRLVVPNGEGPYRLLLLDDKETVVRVLTLETRGAKRAAPAEVALRSAYLGEPYAGGHMLRLEGKLDGDAVFHADLNTGNLTAFGDRGRWTKLASPEVKVQLKEVALGDDRVPSYKLYDLVGLAEPTRLLIDIRDGGPPRLLGLKDGKVVRVVTMEPMYEGLQPTLRPR